MSGVVPRQLSLLSGCLGSRDRAVLAFAREHHLQGQVRGRVEVQLGMTETRYYQLLVGLLGRPEVADAEPDLVAGLQALQDSRRRRRRSQLRDRAPGVP